MGDLVLRPLDPVRDGPALHAVFGDEASCLYMPGPAFASVEETVARLVTWTTGCEDTSWAVALEPDGPAVARVSIYPRDRAVWECACMVVPAARGARVAARALAPAIDYVFETKGARRIFADVDPDNTPSARTFERLGFQREGRLRGTWETHLGLRDSLIFGLLATDPRTWRTG